MATQKATDDSTLTQSQKLAGEWKRSWDALEPIRSTWDEKEKSLLAQTNDSVSGKITAARVSDAALSTLAFERQARVSAQLPTGRVYPLSKKDSKNAKLMNIILNRYIMPNADSQFDLLIKIRLWGVYASVYGSMPMFYDYRVDDRYIGPDCWLVDPRCFAPVSGFHNVQEAGCFISTMMGVDQLERILERKTTSYDKAAIKKLLELAKDARPTADDDSTKTNTTVGQRYDASQTIGKVEIVTKYTAKKWISFAPDYPEIEPIRIMDNPHKSGRVPVVMRHCFPLLNSIFGLGDFERGMKVQKAKDSIINLFLEGAKMRVYPPLKIITSMVTPSTIQYQAGTKWQVKQQNAVEAMDFGRAPLGEFQATYSALQSMLMNMFGTSDTSINTQDSGNPAFGKTPEALKMLSARENARDTWDRFMAEKAQEELFEGMLNLLQVKMEKPIDFAVFEDDIKALGYTEEITENGTVQPTSQVQGLEVYEGAKNGKMTVMKNMIKSDKGYSYLIDANSSMKQDDEQQFQALMATWQLTHSTEGLAENLMQNGMEYDEAEHLKAIFIGAGITDWERILKELSPKKMAQMQQMLNPEPPMNDPMGGMGMPPQPQMPSMEPPMFQDPQIAQVAQQLLAGM